MTLFWIISGALALVVLAAIYKPLRTEKNDTSSGAAKDLQVYRDQLSEIDRDVARGVFSPAEAKNAKLEISRRILDADKRATQEEKLAIAPTGLTMALVVVSALVLLGGGAGVYLAIGAPGAKDQPLQDRIAAAQWASDNRPSQEEVENTAKGFDLNPPAEYVTLVERLRETVASRPDDLTGLRLLAQHEAGIGEFVKARQAQEKVIAALGDQASANDFAVLGENMVLAADGYVSPQAEAALGEALKRDARNQRARYFSGLALAQNGRPDIAYRMWSGLLDEGPQDAPWIAPIKAQIGAVARAAGISRIDPNPPGPSARDVENAQSMSDEDRDQMVRSMVDRLSERLATQGGEPTEWARLINALTVLGETENARAIWEEATQKYAGNDQALRVINDAAAQAGFAN